MLAVPVERRRRGVPSLGRAPSAAGRNPCRDHDPGYGLGRDTTGFSGRAHGRAAAGCLRRRRWPADPRPTVPAARPALHTRARRGFLSWRTAAPDAARLALYVLLLQRVRAQPDRKSTRLN